MKQGFLLVLLMGSCGACAHQAVAQAKPRLIVLTDIGGDPDDQQSLVRLLTYANEFDLEGLIASASGTPGELGEDVVKPELLRSAVEAYGQVRDNLSQHKRGYPTAQDLLSRVKRGNPHRGTEHVGPGHDTEGSDWIIAAVDRADPRPVNLSIWGGSTDLAQALWRVRQDRSPEQLARFISKLRVHAISHQDDTGPWIVEQFPGLFYVLNKAPDGQDKRKAAFRGMYLGGDESLTSRAWIDAHVRTGHGPLGALYPPETWTAPNPHGALKEGDTPSWFYFLPNGLGSPEHPAWGGWGGRFEHQAGGLYRDAEDTVDAVTSARATVWRWRPTFQADFQARMDWCVRPYDAANHNPIARVQSGTERAVTAGTVVSLDASASSDPDADSLSFNWMVYPEAGTYKGKVVLQEHGTARARFVAPDVTRPETIHVVLTVTDSGAPPLSSYRRIVVTVRPETHLKQSRQGARR